MDFLSFLWQYSLTIGVFVMLTFSLIMVRVNIFGIFLLLAGLVALLAEVNIAVFVLASAIGSSILIFPEENYSKESVWTILKEAYREF